MATKVMDTDILTTLNTRAVRENKNRALTDDFIESLDPEGIHLVVYSMVHNDRDARCELFCKVKDSMDPVRAWLDVDLGTFNLLPTTDDLVDR